MHTRQLAELARRQHGVFARWQASQLGFSHEAIAQRIKHGEWRVVLGRVLTAATTELDPLGRDWAGYLAAGPGAVLGGPSAATRHGLAVPSAAVWVVVPPERHLRIPGVRSIREAVLPVDIVSIEGMRVTGLKRTIVDCLRVMPQRQAQPLLDRALLRGWLTVEDLGARTFALAGRRGVSNLRSHLKRAQTGARSEAERLAHSILTEAGISGWEANYKIQDSDGRLQAVLDIAFERERVALEIDGLAFHADTPQFQRDRTRQNWLVNLGWTVLRFTWHDLTQRPGYVVATVRAALAAQDPTDRSDSR